VSWDVTAIVGGVFALVGVAFGLLGDRWLRYWGDVHCRIELGQAQHDRGSSGPLPLKIDQQARVHFFNDKEVDTGLSEIAVVFVYEGGEKIVLGPETRGYETSTSPRGVINLPSKTWVSVKVEGQIYGDAVERALSDPTAMEVKGKFPRGAPYHERCSGYPKTPPPAEMPSFWRVLLGG
jgi:hypothetical protein